MWSNSTTALELRTHLRVPSRAAALADVPSYARRYFGACLTPACGFKLLPGQLRPPSRMGDSLGEETRGQDARESSAAAARLIAAGGRRILLERLDVAAEFASWRRALTSGNWGTTPRVQAAYARLAEGPRDDEAWARLNARTGCRGCFPPWSAAGAASRSRANRTSYARFRREHAAFFRHARDKVAPSTPLLHVYSEELTASRASCEDAMRRLFAFLGVPPLPAVCDRAGAPAPECRGGDGLCSVEKLRAPPPGYTIDELLTQVGHRTQDFSAALSEAEG